MFNPYNQDMNNKPVVSVPATETPFKQTDQDAAPVVQPAPTKSAFGSDVMPKNSVTDGSSARLQNAIREPGRATVNGAPTNFE